MSEENTSKSEKKKGDATERKETVVLKKHSDKKGSVRYATDKPGGAIDNVYVYRDSQLMKGGDVPESITVTIRAGAKE